MRLLNTSTLILQEFFGDYIPYYAILSHRWEDAEVTFQDFQAGIGAGKAGYSKIKGCCAQAILDGLDYAWIDSCCIDKTSSAELSEAINSMFGWYREAQVCYAYLSDVPPGGDWKIYQDQASAVRSSLWFTRGWTLQELLAPEDVVFFDREWVDIGTKASMSELISSITGITRLDDFERSCVAQKLCWASRRNTTRAEDAAYCLMGLFGVNMPLLYGEGDKAFLRLQQEILRTSDDESIFAWQHEKNDEGGLLAPSIAAFAKSGDIMRNQFGVGRAPYSMTNQGLHVEVTLVPATKYPGPMAPVGHFLAPINCCRGVDKRSLAIRLRRVYRDQFVRTSTSEIFTLPEEHDESLQRSDLIYVKQKGPVYSPKHSSSALLVLLGPILDHGFLVSQQLGFKVQSAGLQDPVQALTLDKRNEFGALLIKKEHNADFVLLVEGWVHPSVHVLDFGPENQLKDVVSNFRDQNLVSRIKVPTRSDRISQLMSSGHSISVAVRRLRKQEKPGKRSYVVDVTMDPAGKLKWADPTPSAVTTPQQSPWPLLEESEDTWTQRLTKLSYKQSKEKTVKFF